jgi:hypothetical protein
MTSKREYSSVNVRLLEWVAEHMTECVPVQPSKAETRAASTYQFRKMSKHVIR